MFRHFQRTNLCRQISSNKGFFYPFPTRNWFWPQQYHRGGEQALRNLSSSCPSIDSSASSTPISPVRSIKIINSVNELVVGKANYKNAAKKTTLVDKSWLIHEFIDAKTEVSIVLRPRRFGKTMNISMMQYFFQYMADEKAGEERVQAFDKTLISKSPHYQTNIGKFLVLRLSLRDIVAFTVERLEELVYTRFRDSVESCACLSGLQIHADIAQVCDTYKLQTIQPLMRLLYTSASKKLSREITFIVLIDEYDSPQQVAFNNGFAEKGEQIMKGFFSALLKDNDYLEKAFCVGILPLAKSGIMSGLNNVEVFDPLDHKGTYCDSFGFTTEEVRALCPNTDGFTFADPPRDICPWEADGFAPDERLEKFYNGYMIAGKKGIYNPWSIVNCVAKKEFNHYWEKSGTSELLHALLWTKPSLFPVLEVCRDLISKSAQSGIPITLDRQPHLKYASLRGEIGPETLWTLLIYTGYLTIDSIRGSTAVVKIPNREVRDIWRQWFLKPYAQDPLMSRPYDMMEHLHHGDRVQFQQLLDGFLRLLSSHDIKKDNESLYHVYVLGISCHLSQRGWQVDSNLESGHGRLDMRLQKENDSKAILIEFKYIKNDEKESFAEKKAAEGLKQIAENKYGDKLRRDVQLVQLASICFHKRNAYYKYGTAKRGSGSEWEYLDENGVSLRM